ncbi:MAG: glucans biosynthesis protein [Firmicutes bacterium ADurb.Bin193]|nr:MAG: glucans biosynthesis protein [Firmicutes bacterium ADurb.Bin193]
MSVKTVAQLTAKTKDSYFQSIRGICIICVVLIHCRAGALYLQNSDHIWNYHYWLILRQIINFAVAVFIFMAGYFTNIEKVKSQKMGYYLKRVTRLVIPFVIWSTFYTIINIAANGFKFDAFKELINLFTGQSSTGLYFIVALIQLIILTPILIKRINKNYFKILCMLLAFVYLASYYTSYYLSGSAYTSLFAYFFPAWLIYYYLGIYVRVSGKDYLFGFKSKGKTDLSLGVLLVIISFAISVTESYLLKSYAMPDSFLVSQLKASNVLYSVCVINLILLIKKYMQPKTQKTLLTLGNNSFGIYFIHIFWLLVINNAIMPYIPFVEAVVPLYQLIQLVLTISLCMLSIKLAKLVFGEKGASSLFGF